MANNIAPARIGELVRAYLVGERESMSKSTALGTIAVDRAFDGLTLVAILAAVTTISGTSAGFQGLGLGAAVLFFAGTLVLVGLARSRPVRVRGLFLRMGSFPAALAKGGRLLDSFLRARRAAPLLKAGVSSRLAMKPMCYVVGEAFPRRRLRRLPDHRCRRQPGAFNSPRRGVDPSNWRPARSVLYGVSSAAAAYAIALHALLLRRSSYRFLLIWSRTFLPRSWAFEATTSTAPGESYRVE
jgi:hypothetical protein